MNDITTAATGQEFSGNASNKIAIVGIGLRYPDAETPEQLWENVLAGRRAFRPLPDERMNRGDYYSPDPHAPDRFYATKAAVLRDFEFDRVKYKVAGSTYRSTDLTHWLALEVAASAMADAGFPDGEGLPKQSTGVVLGNSLTGEFSRANVMRLRWPYVRRSVAAALGAKGWDEAEIGQFLAELEPQYKAPFPPIDEDSLAGGLANTIAGRICNFFDLHGGGFTVDGACSSSLLSVVSAGNALVNGDLDVALAGGVDLSIDPFEVIGFAKTGALATKEMRVYDKNSCGFWPGEGAGVLVLMREQDAVEQGKRIYASIAGWGVSSDGKGGITRPEADGHRLAITRAYRRAGYGVETVSYFEGHGTGTAVGDETEIRALSEARKLADPDAAPAALGTVKGNIGHTKAAAGVAGLIKAALAVFHQVVPPATSNVDPHPALTADDAAVYVPDSAGLWPADRPVRAGVSAMGFGGINSHVAVTEAPSSQRRSELPAHARDLVSSRQDAELLLIDADDLDGLRQRAVDLAELAAKLSFAELADLSGALAAELGGRKIRAAVVASDPDEAAAKLTRLADRAAAGESAVFSASEGVYLGSAATAPKITFLFPGQGSGRGVVGAIRRRFADAEEIFAQAALPEDSDADQVATEVAQPRIVTGSLAGLRVLDALGVRADTAVGHSLGELTALHWAGAIDEASVQRLAGVRGKVMATASAEDGAMASIAASPDAVERLLEGESVVIAGYNGPEQTVVSGPADAVVRVRDRALNAGIQATRLAVSHAFHSPLVEQASVAMGERLAEFDFQRLAQPVVSTVTGDLLHGAEDLPNLLQEQIVLPVRFREAAARATERADLAIEVGPGRVLSGLLAEIAPSVPALALDTDSASLAGLLGVVGASFALGADVRTDGLFAGRVVRPLPLDGDMSFLASPCEAAPELNIAPAETSPAAAAVPGATPHQATAAASQDVLDAGDSSTFELLRKLAAERVELPPETITVDTHPLDDLHLSSITVGQIVNEVTRALGHPPFEAMPNFATVCLGELAEMIDELAETQQGSSTADAVEVPGVAPWVRPFQLTWAEAAQPVLDIPQGVVTAEWPVYAPAGHPLAEPLRTALASAGLGNGVLLCLPAECDASHASLFLDAAREVVGDATGTRFVVVQQSLGASGLAKTLRLEDPSARTTVVTLPDVEAVGADAVDGTVRDVVAEVAATTDFSEVRYTADGRRTVPRLSLADAAPAGKLPSPLGETDVLLVTGGGKGITAECALAIAKESGARLGLLGRSRPEEDEELKTNLDRMSAAGVRYSYHSADVTSVSDVATAVAAVEKALGTVTAVLHGAGRNSPAALFTLSEEEFSATLAPKIDGLNAVLDAVDCDKIKLLVTFGSIIGRAGLRGEAHYATANDWMTELTLRFGEEHPNARVLALEWSVWSGAGMGEKLGVVEALKRDGITPIPAEEGIDVLQRTIADPSAGSVLVVCGRTGGLDTLPVQRADLPLTRFVDRVNVYYPGIELITEADLTEGSDPYLGDHLLDGDLLFPAVVGMEAMTQVASATFGSSDPPEAPLLENVEFLRPVIVPRGGSTTVRLAALAGDGYVDVAIRSSETSFSADHFRARLRFPRPEVPADGGVEVITTDLPQVPVDPGAELYGDLLFQGKRFQRLLGYRKASARHAIAEVAARPEAQWFAPFLPQDQLLADPGTRDVVMHALQCCVPDGTLLPQGVEKLYLARPAEQDVDYVVLDAREVSQDGDSYRYDVDVRTPDGVAVERWEGLQLRAVRKSSGEGPWVPSMLGGYLERAFERHLGGSRAVVVEPDPAGAQIGSTVERREQTALAVGRASGGPVQVTYRPDGKPEVEGAAVSASHGAGLTFALVAPEAATVACDVESVVDRGAENWADLLGPDLTGVRDVLAADAGEPADVAATRVWSAMECIRKTGLMTHAVAVQRVHDDGWVVLSAGDARIATWVTTIHDRAQPVVFAALAEEER